MSEFEEKVLELLKTINDKLDKVLKEGGAVVAESAASASASSVSTPSPSTTATTGPATTRKPSDIVDKQAEEEKMIEKPPIEGRRICPKCNGTAFKEEEDRTRVLHQMGGMKIYKKKQICKSCGYEL